jgi:hypothetical protein
VSYHWSWYRCPLRGDGPWRDVSIPARWILPGGDVYIPMSCPHGVDLAALVPCSACRRDLALARRDAGRPCRHRVPGSEPCPACASGWRRAKELSKLRAEAAAAAREGPTAILLLALRWQGIGYRAGLFGRE